MNLISGRGPKARRSYLKQWARPINVDKLGYLKSDG